MLSKIFRLIMGNKKPAVCRDIRFGPSDSIPKWADEYVGCSFVGITIGHGSFKAGARFIGCCFDDCQFDFIVNEDTFTKCYFEGGRPHIFPAPGFSESGNYVVRNR